MHISITKFSNCLLEITQYFLVQFSLCYINTVFLTFIIFCIKYNSLQKSVHKSENIKKINEEKVLMKPIRHNFTTLLCTCKLTYKIYINCKFKTIHIKIIVRWAIGAMTLKINFIFKFSRIRLLGKFSSA